MHTFPGESEYLIRCSVDFGFVCIGLSISVNRGAARLLHANPLAYVLIITLGSSRHFARRKDMKLFNTM